MSNLSFSNIEKALENTLNVNLKQFSLLNILTYLNLHNLSHF